MADLKLYIWDDGVLTDYGDGLMVALAESEEQARELLRAYDRGIPEHDLAKQPRVVSQPVAVACWGSS